MQYYTCTYIQTNVSDDTINPSNIFMCYLKELAIDNYTGKQRYVDETFLIFDTKEDSIAFFDFMNPKNDNIKLLKRMKIIICHPFLMC